MRKIICTAALAAFLLSGCGSGSISVIELSPDVLTEAKAISPDNVYDLPELFFAGSYGDRYAVCEMVTQEFAAEVYDLKEGKVAGKLLHYGNGPHEVLVPLFNIFGDTLQVVDIQKNRLFMIPCADLPDAGIAREIKYDFITLSLVSCGDSLLALNPFYFENDDLDIHNGEPMFFYSDGGKAPYDASKIMTAGVVQGQVAVHPESGRVVFANSVESEIFILNKDLSVNRRITGPRHESTDYAVAEGQLLFSGNIANTYLSACSDREYVYLIYDGKYYDLYDDNVDRANTDHDLYLFQMDWDGRLEGCYSLEGLRYVGVRLSCGSQPGTVYVSALSPDEENLQIFYYDLRKYN